MEVTGVPQLSTDGPKKLIQEVADTIGLFPNGTVAQCMPVVGYQIHFLKENCCHGGNFSFEEEIIIFLSNLCCDCSHFYRCV